MRNPLHSLCPYFAMFPEQFVEEQVRAWTAPGEYVLDPFSGRGTTVFQSLLMGRNAAGLDTNPVAYCISAAKAQVPTLQEVTARIRELEGLYQLPEHMGRDDLARSLPPFFRRAFYHTTLRELMFLRSSLDWRDSLVDRFIAALALGSLHGEMDKSPYYFSNQMPRTISTKPDYSLRYWKKRRLWPRKRKVFAILTQRATFRLRGEAPSLKGEVVLDDARNASRDFPHLEGKIRAVITSPPYFNVTNYEEDQWLRLWFLGYGTRPSYRSFSNDDRHTATARYWTFLKEVWAGIKPLLAKESVLVCRMGAKDLTLHDIGEGMCQTVISAFPSAGMVSSPRVSGIVNPQTRAFRPRSKGCVFEVDFSFELRP
jgi:hypothetical protein